MYEGDELRNPKPTQLKKKWPKTAKIVLLPIFFFFSEFSRVGLWP